MKVIRRFDFLMGRRRQRCSGPVSSLLVLVLAAGCSSATAPSAAGSSEHARQAILGRGERVVVLPLREGSPLPVYGNHVMCHLTGEHLAVGEVPEGTGEELGELLADRLDALGAEVVPYDRGRGLFSAVDPEVVDRYEPALAADLGRGAGAAKAILGIVTQFEERSGSALASAHPARVSFSLALVDVDRGVVTHKLAFNREQAPLTANLFSIGSWWRRGFRWWTREEVAEDALGSAARALLGVGDDESAWPDMPPLPPPEYHQW